MPRDGNLLVQRVLDKPVAPMNLRGAIGLLGLSPVPRAHLNEHKRQEVDKRPAHWAYLNPDKASKIRQRVYLASMLFLAIGDVTAIYSRPYPVIHQIGLAIGTLAMMAMIIDALAGLLYRPWGGAEWSESYIMWTSLRDDKDVHPEVFDLARRVRAVYPNVSFKIGKLFRSRSRMQPAFLDPYLIAVDNTDGHEVILGIWDGDKLIASA